MDRRDMGIPHEVILVVILPGSIKVFYESFGRHYILHVSHSPTHCMGPSSRASSTMGGEGVLSVISIPG